MSDTYNNDGLIRQLLNKTSTDSKSWLVNATCDGQDTKMLAFLNAHALNTAAAHQAFANALLKSNFLLRDGIGVKIAMGLFGLEPGPNLNGTDLIPQVIRKNKGRSIAIFGASLEALTAVKSRLEQEEGIQTIVSLEHGFHDFPVYLQICEEKKPDIVILCMGMPKQEVLAAELVRNHVAKLVICGGGWADFYSGTKKRAPVWVRKLSLEWIYRLLSEPKRLGKRYTVDILKYFYVILRARYIDK